VGDGTGEVLEPLPLPAALTCMLLFSALRLYVDASLACPEPHLIIKSY
jgi:hypothetical protein